MFIDDPNAGDLTPSEREVILDKWKVARSSKRELIAGAEPRCEECDPSFTCFDGSATCRKPARCPQAADDDPERPPISPGEMAAHREALERFEDEISSKVARAAESPPQLRVTEMRALVERREAEASKRGLWSAREPAMALIRHVMHEGGLGLGNLHATVGDYGNAGGKSGWLIELRWWQLKGMRPAQFNYSVALRDEHEFSHAVRAVAAALLVRAMGAFGAHREQWQGGR